MSVLAIIPNSPIYGVSTPFNPGNGGMPQDFHIFLMLLTRIQPHKFAQQQPRNQSNLRVSVGIVWRMSTPRCPWCVITSPS